MKKFPVAFVFLVLMLFPLPLARGEMGQAKLPVFVSIIPQAYFVERIGGKHVDVNVLIGEGQSPHSYEPTPKQMAKLATAKAYFCIGVPTEKGIIRKIQQSHRKLLIVETQRGIVYRYLSNGHHHDHLEKQGKRQSAEWEKEPDPHIWMDPELVKIQAQNIQAALEHLDPLHKREYLENLHAFQADLDRVNARIARSLAPFRGSSMYVFHPAFGYFADAYGMKQVAIEIEGKEPSARQLAELIDRAKKDQVRVMFVQPQFSRKGAEAVAKVIGGVVVPIDPLAREYLANLERIAAAVEQGLR